ncbi:FAD-dependent oxidoreductase [Arthrobacter cupressi]|uniref:Pyridine nucleotide-disulphide oxidoreductase n=1 Tax=Arthrobacter cupressi TaxID=1045773 RepID=A0A1G8J087_9MICC|nr:FAD-dependent oxidoreductase [Arthrobacter cupressi]NYD79182.1 NAD(P)H-nitrite reductase large subunit [Arthrobacter cupressi]SDI24492.1 Pyridine nucleotide-disulphide oxidoreductase [Arthrobacter cupressi]
MPDTSTHLVIAGAGPAAQALLRHLTGMESIIQQGSAAATFEGRITVLSNRDECPEALLETAAHSMVSVRFGQLASFIDPTNRKITTTEGLEFSYDQLVIATGSAPVEPPVHGAEHALAYSTIDDAERLGSQVKEITDTLGRRPLGILVGTGPSAGQAEAVLRARGVRPVRTTLRPAAVVSSPVSGRAAAGIVFDDGSIMNGDLVVLAEERTPRSTLAESAGLKTAPDGGILVGSGFESSVPGIWAIGDAAARDGLRLGLVLSAKEAAARCAAYLAGHARSAAAAGRPAPSGMQVSAAA